VHEFLFLSELSEHQNPHAQDGQNMMMVDLPPFPPPLAMQKCHKLKIQHQTTFIPRVVSSCLFHNVAKPPATVFLRKKA
jgi:hypothetical protein